LNLGKRMNKTYLRRSQLAFGLSLICLLFLLETWNADRVMPHPASPFIWAALGLAGGVAFAAGCWWRYQARQAEHLADPD
jgi:hypothetical protein